MKYFLLLALSSCFLVGAAQTTKQQYPTPEYSNEIYLFKKDSIKVIRLEKGSSKVVTSTKMGGMGGADNGYSIDGDKSPIRITGGNNLCFIYFTGQARSANSQSDSVMLANGMDPSSMGDPMAMINDPSRTTSLYSMNVEKTKRTAVIMAYSGMKILGKGKKESTKYTLGIKKIRDGYYELDVDKPLPKGEYAFIMNDMTSSNGSSLVFAFGVD